MCNPNPGPSFSPKLIKLGQNACLNLKGLGKWVKLMKLGQNICLNKILDEFDKVNVPQDLKFLFGSVVTIWIKKKKKKKKKIERKKKLATSFSTKGPCVTHW